MPMTLTRCALAAAVFALAQAYAAATPAYADYAVVRFGDGACRIWWDARATPWGNDWTKIAITPDRSAAEAALDAAIAGGACDD